MAEIELPEDKEQALGLQTPAAGEAQTTSPLPSLITKVPEAPIAITGMVPLILSGSAN